MAKKSKLGVVIQIFREGTLVLSPPAEAGYYEGNISCVSGWNEYTASTSFLVRNHSHYMEYNGSFTQYSVTYAAQVWYGSTNYGTWSTYVNMHSSGTNGWAGCT